MVISHIGQVNNIFLFSAISSYLPQIFAQDVIQRIIDATADLGAAVVIE